MQTGVLTNISSRLRSAIIGRPLPEQTDFGPTDPRMLSWRKNTRNSHCVTANRQNGVFEKK